MIEAPDDEEAVLVAECDLPLIEETRRDCPFLRDRRIDAYDGLTSRFRDSGIDAEGASDGEESSVSQPDGSDSDTQ